MQAPGPNDREFLPPDQKVKTFPKSPGVYLMKDTEGRVIYIGKAKVLRNRASSYFTQAAREDSRTRDMVPLIADIDFIPAATEVDALLMEARLVKDVQPRFNVELKDSKTFPYLQIRVGEEFPRVEFTRNPRRKGVRLYGPFTSAKSLRQAIQVLQRIFKFRNCHLDISSKDPKWRWYRPCLLHSIRQCTGPCNFRVTREEYRKQIRALRLVLEGKKKRLLRELAAEMSLASNGMLFEKAARIRDEIKAIDSLGLRGNVETDLQPEAFAMDPKKGLVGLRKILGLKAIPRSIECIDIAHLAGEETVASLVCFIDGMPFKHGYRRYRIKTVQGIDDFASIREAVSRRYGKLGDESSSKESMPAPDIILIDGGKGQLSAAKEALAAYGVQVSCLISLAKREEEIYTLNSPEPIRLGRNSVALKLLQHARDEAHRFAQHYHHLLRGKKLRDDFKKSQ